MLSSLFWENAHFAVNLFTFLAFVAALWLHLDAWMAKKRTHGLIGIIGWFMLAIAFLINSGHIESTVLADQFFSESVFSFLILTTKIIGYLFIAVFAWREPIQLHPKLHNKPSDSSKDKKAPTSASTKTPVKETPQKPNETHEKPVTESKTQTLKSDTSTTLKDTPKPNPPEEKPKNIFARIFSIFKRKKKTEESKPVTPEPVLSTPKKYAEDKKKSEETGPVVAGLGFVFKSITYTLSIPLIAAAISLAYLRRSTIGIERHVKPLFYTFLLFTIYEVLALAPLWRNSANPTIFKLAAAYGPLWIAEIVLLLAASATLLTWVSKYLLRRLKTQLFMIFISMALGAFIITATAFSALLLQNMQSAALDRLQTDARIFRLMLEQKQDEIVSDAQVLAQDERLLDTLELRALAASSSRVNSSEVGTAVPSSEVVTGNTGSSGSVAAGESLSDTDPGSIEEADATITSLIRNILLGKEIDTLIITDAEGKILARGEDPDQTEGSLSDNPLIATARQGQLATGFVKQEGAIAPVVAIRAAVPIQSAGQVVGVVLAGTILDNPFLDGIKRASNLDTVLYTDNILSASTLESTNDSSRWIGTLETNTTITKAVLEEKQELQTNVNLLGQPYLASYIPLANDDQQAIGMLLVGVPQIFVLRTAAESIQITFLISAALMILSIPLSLFFANKISKQVS